MAEKEKRIEVVKMKVGDLKTGFGNPRKISQSKLKELEESLETYGDFGIFIIDENDNLIAGNQRAYVLRKKDPDIKVTCKKLYGYTVAEKRAINIKDNVHMGEWDLDALADWTADLNIDLGKDLNNSDVEGRNIKDMELIHYEKYDYVMIVCRNQLDYNNLVRTLGIEGAKVAIAKRKINARAIWYDKMNAKLVPLTEEEIKQRDAFKDEPVWENEDDKASDSRSGTAGENLQDTRGRKRNGSKRIR